MPFVVPLCIMLSAMHPYIIGISGGSGSGKTTFIRELMSRFEPTQVCLISQDNYYKPVDQQPLDHKGIPNYDTPFSINIQELVEHITELKNNRAVSKMEYNFNNPSLHTSLLTFEPAPVLVIEGIFLFDCKPLADLFDFKIFIETKDHLRFKRRILRDTEERGNPLDEILYRMEEHVEPGYKRWVEPYKEEADMIIPNHTQFHKALDVVEVYIRSKLR